MSTANYPSEYDAFSALDIPGLRIFVILALDSTAGKELSGTDSVLDRK
nr:hypothetical protein [Rhodococcus sp. (in: high G+C Gram-positive bacteria)]